MANKKSEVIEKTAQEITVTEEMKETTAAAVEAVESKSAEAESKIYIGASFKGVATGTVFKGGKLAPALEDAIKAVPAIKELVIPVSKLVDARKQLQNKDSALSRFYEAAKNDVRGE